MVELGNKHECLNCSTKFYDLGNSQLICPSCGGDQAELAKEAADQPGSKKAGAAKGTKAKKAKKAKTKASKSAKDKDDKEAEEVAEESGDEESSGT